MAMKNSETVAQAWKYPVWPEALPAAESMRAVYGPEADELTIRFPDTPNRDIVVVFLDIPRVEYAGLMIHEYTGDVVGVQVDYLAHYASAQHPFWRKATEPHPPSAVARCIVSDIKELYDRYGIGADAPDSR